MTRLDRSTRQLIGRSPVTYSATLTAVVAKVFTLALVTAARGVDQPGGLTVQSHDVITLTEQAQNGRVYDLAFSPRRGSAVCAVALERSVQLWDLSAKPRRDATLTQLRPANRTWMDADWPRPIAFSSNGERLAVGYFGVELWDTSERKILFAVPIELWPPAAVQFSPTDGTLIVGCCWRWLGHFALPVPGMIQVISRGDYERMPVADASSFKLSRDYNPEERPAREPREKRNIYCLAVSPDGKRFVGGGDEVFIDVGPTSSRKPSASVWDTATGRLIFDIGDAETRILRFCLSPDGRILYSCGAKVLSWDATKAAPPIQTFDAGGSRTLSIAVSPDGATLAAGGLDGTVMMWDIGTAKRLATLKHQAGPVYRVAFSPGSGKLVAAGEGGVATVWDVELHPGRGN
jgi:WD40 repeat protein